MTQTTGNGVADLIGFDLTDPEFRSNPYSQYGRLRERAPVFRSPLGFWMLTTYRDCLAVLQDDRFGYPRGDKMHVGDSIVAGYTAQQHFMIFMNPPDHTRIRGHVRNTLSPKVVHGLAPYVQAAVDRLLDDMAATGPSVDLISSYAHGLPFGVISELLGVPDADRPMVMKLAAVYLDGIGPAFAVNSDQHKARDAALDELTAFFTELANLRREHPTTDMLTQLVAVQDEGGLSPEELVGTCVMLFVAGHSTTTNLIGNSTIALLRDPEAKHRFMTEPNLGSNAIEELVRFDTPTQQSFRIAMEDVPLGEYMVKAGDKVLIIRGAANRDPSVFPNPDKLMLDRQDNRHVGFGAGRHVCVGSALARLQTRISLTSLFNRYPDLAFADEDALEWYQSLMVRGVKALPVSLGI